MTQIKIIDSLIWKVKAAINFCVIPPYRPQANHLNKSLNLSLQAIDICRIRKYMDNKAILYFLLFFCYQIQILKILQNSILITIVLKVLIFSKNMFTIIKIIKFVFFTYNQKMNFSLKNKL